jgi:threonine dehydratase
LELSEKTNGFTGIRSILVPIGGGGLLAGIGASMQNLSKKPRLIGVQSEASAFMHSLFYTGSQSGVEECDSLADGLSGTVDPNSITIPLVKHFADEIVLVSEKQIIEAIRYCWEKHHQQIEGSAAVVLASVMSKKVDDFPVIIVISGGNIQSTKHQSIIQGLGNLP